MLGFFCLFCEIFQTYLFLQTAWARAKNMWFGVCTVQIFTTLLEHLLCDTLYICSLTFTISIHARDYYLYYTPWKLNLREIKSVVQNHMARTWYLNPSIISGTLNCKMRIIKCGVAVRIKRNIACQSTVKLSRACCRWSSLLFKPVSPSFELKFQPVSEELNLPLGWIENLLVALADWGMHRTSWDV